jgi:cell division protein ZapA (FtsZ GTPase activity inhibitor)
MSAVPESKANLTTVRIYGTEYAFRSQQEPEYVKQVADRVDQEMRRLSQNRVVRSTLEVAVLAGMHLADELYRTRQQLSEVLQRVGDTTEAMAKIIDAGSSTADK